MNDTMTLLLATAILGAGGLGLFMYKNSDNKSQKGGDDYDEDNLFGSVSFWGSNNEDENNDEDYDEEVYEPKVRSRGGKTKRRKSGGGTKRRY